ncbi:MAG: hypothetical protein EZS28_022747 [Streblomastix strix]|uniref:Uncharacterized protein n=1 Tax=Streblomastix strix TaxID=222440 RepID=A0A5J4VHB5_9EUKA|nr:MAG: hypothetical protein EZS28_022747 [Streblomastix strix]
MDKPVERKMSDGVEEYVLQGGALDIEFSTGDFSQLNLHQKIDLAYKRMVDIGLDLIPLPPPTPSPDIPEIINDEQYEQMRQDQYFNKWIKQNKHLSSKYKEFYYYLMENEDEIMSTDITEENQINIIFPLTSKIPDKINQLKKHPSEFANNCLSEIELLNYEEEKELDDIKSVKLGLIENQIKMSEIEISDYGEEFDDVLNKHGEFLGPNEVEISENDYDQICEKYEEQCQKLDQIQSFMRMSGDSIQYSNEFRKANLMFIRTSALNPKRFISRFMDQNYIHINPFRESLKQSNISLIYKIKENLDSLNVFLIFLYIYMCVDMRNQIVEQEFNPLNIFRRKVKNQLKTSEKIFYQYSSSSSSSSTTSSSSLPLPTILIPNLNAPAPPDQQPSSISQDDYEDYKNSFSNGASQLFAQIDGKLHPVQGIIRTNQDIEDDSYQNNDGDQTSDYISGSSYQQSATVVEDKDDNDKYDKEKNENVNKDAKKEKTE